jgi:hypothetical protein
MRGLTHRPEPRGNGSGDHRNREDQVTVKIPYQVTRPWLEPPLEARVTLIADVRPQDVAVGESSTTTRGAVWLARKDSNLQSPDPEMDERFGPSRQPSEHERPVSNSCFRDELSARPKLNHVPNRNGR